MSIYTDTCRKQAHRVLYKQLVKRYDKYTGNFSKQKEYQNDNRIH